MRCARERARRGRPPRRGPPRRSGVADLPDSLADTGVLIGSLRRQPLAMQMLQGLREELKLISALKLAEVLIGTDPKWEGDTRKLVDLFDVVVVDDEIARVAGRLGRRHRRTHGRQTVDLLLAATAMVHGLVLVTTNARDFPMPELRLYPQSI